MNHHKSSMAERESPSRQFNRPITVTSLNAKDNNTLPCKVLQKLLVNKELYHCLLLRIFFPILVIPQIIHRSKIKIKIFNYYLQPRKIKTLSILKRDIIGNSEHFLIISETDFHQSSIYSTIFWLSKHKIYSFPRTCIVNIFLDYSFYLFSTSPNNQEKLNKCATLIRILL